MFEHNYFGNNTNFKQYSPKNNYLLPSELSTCLQRTLPLASISDLGVKIDSRAAEM